MAKATAMKASWRPAPGVAAIMVLLIVGCSSDGGDAPSESAGPTATIATPEAIGTSETIGTSEPAGTFETTPHVADPNYGARHRQFELPFIDDLSGVPNTTRPEEPAVGVVVSDPVSGDLESIDVHWADGARESFDFPDANSACLPGLLSVGRPFASGRIGGPCPIDAQPVVGRVLSVSSGEMVDAPQFAFDSILAASADGTVVIGANGIGICGSAPCCTSAASEIEIATADGRRFDIRSVFDGFCDPQVVFGPNLDVVLLHESDNLLRWIDLSTGDAFEVDVESGSLLGVTGRGAVRVVNYVQNEFVEFSEPGEVRSFDLSTGQLVDRSPAPFAAGLVGGHPIEVPLVFLGASGTSHLWRTCGVGDRPECSDATFEYWLSVDGTDDDLVRIDSVEGVVGTVLLFG